MYETIVRSSLPIHVTKYRTTKYYVIDILADLIHNYIYRIVIADLINAPL